MKVLLLEPYYGGSHKRWADGFVQSSTHQVTLLTLPAQAWKWRMQGGAVTMARLYRESGIMPDVILASDMMDLTIFRALTRDRLHSIPVALYFHENQLTYPQNSRQGHGWRYGFINYASALAADRVYFNSAYHRDVFIETLPDMLKHFYDSNELASIAPLRERADVLPVGLNLKRFDHFRSEGSQLGYSDATGPMILWNHRWESDKNPGVFLRALDKLAEDGVPFRVALVGENPRHSAPEFLAIRARLGKRVVAYGYLPDFAHYARLLWEADIVVSSARQEFFGIAVVEAMYCGCTPILPDRLNYPYLLPAAYRDVCLYPDDHALIVTLRRHLTQGPLIDTTDLMNHVERYDWSSVAPQYDYALSQLAQVPPGPVVW